MRCEVPNVVSSGLHSFLLSINDKEKARKKQNNSPFDT